MLLLVSPIYDLPVTTLSILYIRHDISGVNTGCWLIAIAIPPIFDLCSYVV
jgi:hypothetical protein